MFSIKGIYKDDKFHLNEPLHFKENANVIITILDEQQADSDGLLEEAFADDESDDDFSAMRKHKRFMAKGNIALIDGDDETDFKLYDYSAGGLSFLSDDPIFERGQALTASIKDPVDRDMSILDFDFKVARCEPFEDKYKVGCMFTDGVDEELWHQLMS